MNVKSDHINISYDNENDEMQTESNINFQKNNRFQGNKFRFVNKNGLSSSECINDYKSI